ncbi:MAG: SDR family oxidoreductase [Hydrogenophaga sp.]|uniref:SDR family oxidoreductase n=1 Tax=Hydrogenophaga sp. TaxID=1904254 RepID=UPI00276BEFBC|nr:SDR family oxidoreductase [Hydrogenophaga sp.]MDP2417309.1 SDR family oxidoreductase [Hydrogenophaga sp.]MDZ4187164.1 SDR family oxidoreductase [Hydrogenophaga sp.]
MTQRFDLTGKVVVVTGGTGLLGSAYCQGLADHGAQVVMADLVAADPVGKARLVKTPDGREAFGVNCDVGVEADVVNLFEQVMARFGQVNVVLNNAAATGEHLMRQGAVFTSFEDSTLAVWESAIRVNLTGVYLVAREGGKAMLKSGGGSMVNVSSTYGVVGPDHRIYEGMKFNSLPSYAAAKAGVHGLTRWLATYWGDKGIRVNTLVPGGVQNNHDPEFVRRYTARVPLGRMAKREDMVGMMIYLSSDASAYSTGQQFFVDGGWTAV